MLFRQEVAAAQAAQYLGSVRLQRPWSYAGVTGLALALALMLVARPLSVLAFQWLSPFNIKETLLISWCGLRGAVPLALSFAVTDAIPRMRGIDPASMPKLVNNAEGIIFAVVMINLLIQGMSLRWLARWLGLSADDDSDQPLATSLD